MGGFQEERQVELAAPYCKYAHAIEHVQRIPYYVNQAVRHSLYGRPGAVYLDFPDDIIRGECEEEDVTDAARVPEPPRTMADPDAVEAALSALESAERPLVVVGKGMAWSRAEDEVREFVERTQLPFLNSPMGKGTMPDDDPLSVGAARSTALREADLVMLLGARLNWIMHFGLPPRFHKDVRIIQLDIEPTEIGANVPAEVALVGDGKAVVGQLNRALDNRQWFYPSETPWRALLKEKAQANMEAVQPMIDDDFRAHQLLPRLQGHRRLAAGRRDHHRRRRQHHGHRPYADAEPPRPPPPGRRHLRNDGRGPGLRHRRRGERTRTSPWSRCRATARSASPAWRSRRWCATTCR